MMSESVDLPAPVEPTSAVEVPAGITKFIPLSDGFVASGYV